MCDTPLYINTDKSRLIDGEYTTQIPVSCGKCPECKRHRVNSWAFRLQQEEKRSISSYFITLTYNTSHVPISERGFMTLCKKDLVKFFKRLRKLQKTKIRYYAVGEYGSSNKRPHYHIILFNVEDIENVFDAWSVHGKHLGNIHFGKVESASIVYTLKYIDKPSQIPCHKNDDRLKEFSLMSKKLGDNYLDKAMVRYHKEDLSRYYVRSDGYKIKMPKYYKDKMYTEDDMKEIGKIMDRKYKKEIKRLEERCKRLYKGKMTIFEYMESQKRGRFNKFYSPNKHNRL